MRDEVAEEDRFAAFARGFARVLADHGVEGHCTWDAPAAEPVRAELRTLITEFVESGKRKRTLRRDLTAEDAFALLWTIAALVEAADEARSGSATSISCWTACAASRLATCSRRRSIVRSGTGSCARPGTAGPSSGYPPFDSAAISAISASSSGTSARRLGRLTTMPSWVLRASTTTASSSGEGFSSRCGT